MVSEEELYGYVQYYFNVLHEWMEKRDREIQIFHIGKSENDHVYFVWVEFMGKVMDYFILYFTDKREIKSNLYAEHNVGGGIYVYESISTNLKEVIDVLLRPLKSKVDTEKLNRACFLMTLKPNYE